MQQASKGGYGCARVQQREAFGRGDEVRGAGRVRRKHRFGRAFGEDDFLGGVQGGEALRGNGEVCTVVVACDYLGEVSGELRGDLARPSADIVGDGARGAMRVVVGVEEGIEGWCVFGTGGQVSVPVGFVVVGDAKEVGRIFLLVGSNDGILRTWLYTSFCCFSAKLG